MVFGPSLKPVVPDQLVAPEAALGNWSFTLMNIWLSPEAFGWGSLAVPETVTKKLLTHWPFSGLEMKTTGPLVSSCPPGAMSRRSEPAEFELALATAIR